MDSIADSARTANIARRKGRDDFLESVLENLPGMVYRCRNDQRWSMVFVSAGSEQLCGYAPAELMSDSRCWGDMIDPADRDRVWDSVQAAVNEQEPFEIEYRIVARDGAVKWVWERGRGVRSSDDRQLIEGYITNVTPLKRQQERLARSEAYFTAIVDTAVDSIITIDEQGRIETFNNAAERLFGYTANEAIGENVRLLMPAPFRDEHEQHIRNYLDTGAANIIGRGRELSAQHKDGTLVPVHLSISEISVHGSRRFAGIIRDLSAEKATEEALRREHELFNVTIEQAPTGMVTYRCDEPFLSVNRVFCEITGYSARELNGMTVQDITHPDDWEESAALATDAQAGKIDRYSHRKRYMRKDGGIVEVRVVNAVVHDADGRPDLFIGQVEDLTPRLKAEAEAREHRERLAHADRLNTLGEMATGIAHEINQPLTAISLFAQAGKRLYNAGAYEKMEEVFDKLSQHAQRAGAVIERMQTMTRRNESAKEIVDCNALVVEISKLAEAEARIRDIVIDLRTEPGLLEVDVDPVQIQQVALNLLRNGMEAMRAVDCRDGRTIRLQTRRRDDGDIEVAVIDCGCGVSDEAARNLFRPFSTTKESGMGMGLSISQAIIAAHGGQLGFCNNDTCGATFSFTLPAAQ